MSGRSAEIACPICGPTVLEPHPRQPGAQRCSNCKTWRRDFPQPAAESEGRGGWFTPGHCEDIDGGQYHLPGECPGARLNCSGRCCGPSSPPVVRCDTCNDTRRTSWMSEADPNGYQERDDEGMVPCIDCALPPESRAT